MSFGTANQRETTSAPRGTAPPLPPAVEAELPFARSTVEVALAGGGAVELHLVEHGRRDAQPVLFLHGNRSWSVTWRQVMRRLGDFRSIAVDLPGFGRSGDLPAGRRSIDGHGEAIAGLVERLGLEDAIVVAHETAGSIAAAASRRLGAEPPIEPGARGAPSRLDFAGAVLVASALLPTGEAPPPTLHRFGAWPRLRDAAFERIGWPALALDALQSKRAQFARASAALYAWPLAERSRRRAMIELAAAAANDDARAEAARWLLDFAGPLALVWGHRDPLMTGDDFAAQERELPYARIWRTEAGHFVQEEEPEAIAAAIAWTAERLGRPADADGIPANFLPGLGSGDYVEVGRDQVHRLVELAGLRAEDRILDLGCGLGRTASALRTVLAPAGRYDGVDVVHDVVRWCRQNLTRVDRRLRFHHAPVRSGLYSPGESTDAREYRFPFESARFDFVVAESLFTHLAAEEATHYLREITRVLRPGGILCVSVFLLDAAARQAIAENRSDHHFETERGEAWVEDPAQPLLAVAFERDWFLRALAAAGLETTTPMAEGAWRGGSGAAAYQDMVVAKKR